VLAREYDNIILVTYTQAHAHTGARTHMHTRAQFIRSSSHWRRSLAIFTLHKFVIYSCLSNISLYPMNNGYIFCRRQKLGLLTTTTTTTHTRAHRYDEVLELYNIQHVIFYDNCVTNVKTIYYIIPIFKINQKYYALR